MKYFVSSLNVPVGYNTPRFPGLYWPLGPDRPKYQAAFLYYSVDAWRFTVYWFLILFGATYLLAGSIAVFNILQHNARHGLPTPKWSPPTVFVFFVLIGLVKGIIGGAIIGVLVGAIYNAGTLQLSTWIPFSWALAGILFDISNSYTTSLVIL